MGKAFQNAPVSSLFQMSPGANPLVNSLTRSLQLFWELTKMGIRTATISFSKGRSKTFYTHENKIKRLLAEFNSMICNKDNLQGIEIELR